MIHTQDADFTLIQADVLDGLRTLADGSVHCVVTSPPYWGLRDYGTGAWTGGDEDCDHAVPLGDGLGAAAVDDRVPFRTGKQYTGQKQIHRDVCGKCGATRKDQQLGLEATPDLYVARMVEVFREVRRVLRADGTCWVNLGDSYASGTGRGYPRDYMDGGAVTDDRMMNNEPRFDIKASGFKPKDLCGIPWRVAFALQADGWYLRSDIIWSKPNPMPESVTDRPTKAHEYVFLLSKGARYFFDQQAVREASQPSSIERMRSGWNGNEERGYPNGPQNHISKYIGTERGMAQALAGRNVRSVWEIATQPYPEAHFATYPEELVRRCVLAGCPEDGTVLDPFLGSGTTAHVARKHGRRSIGIELNPDYCDLAARRMQQQSLLV